MNDFQQWFNELELFGLRSERFYEDVQEWMLDYQEDPEGLAEKLTRWLDAAYNAGYHRGYDRGGAETIMKELE